MDPITELLNKLAESGASSGTVSSGATGELAGAAELIPSRGETKVKDLLDSPDLATFRQQYVNGMIETTVINKVIDIVKAVLAAKGII